MSKLIKRRSFLKGAAVVGAGAAAVAASNLAAPAIAQGKRELKMVTTWPKNFPGLSDQLPYIAVHSSSVSCLQFV